MAITSYTNFISFLNDKNSIIDHTYLWDIITSPNKNLFIQSIISLNNKPIFEDWADLGNLKDLKNKVKNKSLKISNNS